MNGLAGTQGGAFASEPRPGIKVRRVLIRRSVVVVLFLACGTRPGVFDAGVDAEDAGGETDAGATDAGFADSGTAATDAGTDGGVSIVDRDLDGLDDALEARIAQDYLPNLSLHPRDDCPLGLIIYRLRPHPADASLIMILYDHLYERDCGIGSHVGDNETFAVTVNPAKPAPAGLTAMKAISHQNTACQKITACGTCSGLAACDLTPDGRPRLYASRDKHGGYAQKSACQVLAICTDDCAAGDQLGVPLANVGEPDAHLIEDLTAAGYITADAGWTRSEVFNFNPWGAAKFGGAGAPSGDLVDAAFDTVACQ